MRFMLLALLLLPGCASVAPRTLRVLVYNIHAGKDASRVDNLERVAALIAESRADLVFLQEVDRGTRRSGNVDQLAELQRRTAMQGVFGKALDFQGGDYGVAILSRWTIASHETVPLHAEGGEVEPRVALFAKIDTPGGTIGVVNTHLDAADDDAWRRHALARLLPAIAARRPLLLGGDFNATPDSAVIAEVRATGLTDAWTTCGRGAELTYPADVPVKRIDYLFLAEGARCREARVLESQASDHRAVVFEVALR